MKLSKIKERINNSGDNNGSVTIYHHDDNIECCFHLFDGERFRAKTIRYKSLEFDLPVNFDSYTIYRWDVETRGFGCKYINYYDERIS